MIKGGTNEPDPLTRTHFWDETRHCLDSLTRSDFFGAYCDRRRPERSLDRNPTRRSPGCRVLSATGGRSRSSPCHSRSMGELNSTSSHRPSPTLDENGSYLDSTCDTNFPMARYDRM